MNLTTNLSEFNRRFTDEWLHIFPAGVEAWEGVDDGFAINSRCSFCVRWP